MGYFTNTLKAIFGKNESSELVLDEQKLSPEDKKLLEIMRRNDNTEKLENKFDQPLNPKIKIKSITRKNPEKIINDINTKIKDSERDER